MTNHSGYLIPRCRPWLLACLGSALIGAAGVTHATTLPWPDAPYSQFAKNKTLDRVLTDFASSFSLGISLPSGVDQPISGRLKAETPTQFLDRLGRQYGLTWYVHGGVLYVGRVRDNQVKALAVPSVGSNNSVRQILTDLQVFQARFGWSELPEQGMAVVTGPRSYVELIERTIGALPQAPGGQQVMMFRLRYAPVDDRIISYRDREIVVPGVATVLRNLMQMNVPGPVRSASGPAQGSTGLAALASASMGGSGNRTGGSGVGFSSDTAVASGGSAAGGGTSAATPAPVAGQAASSQGAPGSAGTNAGNQTAGSGSGGGFSPVSVQLRPRPSIQSDARLNAIIVQDAPDRIPLYANLIAQMDIPAPLIEIEALIVDVNTSKLEELGISWGARGRGGSTAGGFGTVNATPDGNTISFIRGNAGVASPTTAILDTATNYLVTRIRALEQQGDASIHARPSILTSENIGAVIDLSETFFIQTTSERSALVTPVTAGTTLRVTPRISRRDDAAAIFMTVDIEDGQVQNASSGSLPSVRKGVVSTEATLTGEQSLLIGGYNSEQRVVGNTKVPILGDLPGLGTFFSNKSDSIQRRERLFLLKARVVTPTSVASAGPALSSSISPETRPVAPTSAPRQPIVR